MNKYRNENYAVTPGLNELNLNFDLFLYNSDAHLKTQTNNAVQTFVQYRNNTPIAVIHFAPETTVMWISPPRSPFGSIQYDPTCSQEEVNNFLDYTIESIKKKGVTSLQIKHYPTCYLFGQDDLVGKSYIQYGFSKTTQVNYHIVVSEKPFTEIITSPEKRRLNKCIRNNFICERNAVRDVKTIYQFLQFCRLKKQYSLSLNEAQLGLLFSNCQAEVHVFTVKYAGKIVALSVTVRVHQKILYNFLTDNHPEYRPFSPSVLLMQGIYDFCQTSNIEILDLGTSLDQHEKEKAGLTRFKKNLGGIPSEKSIFNMDWPS